MQLVGWTGAWTSPYRHENLTNDRRNALIECIRKRRYNFTYDSHQMLPYAAPVYEDNTVCVLTKKQWESVMDEAYGEDSRGQRLMPQDILTSKDKTEVLYENEKFNNHSGG